MENDPNVPAEGTPQPQETPQPHNVPAPKDIPPIGGVVPAQHTIPPALENPPPAGGGVPPGAGNPQHGGGAPPPSAGGAPGYSGGGMGMEQLPNATAALVLGIVSIALCWCYGIVGLITGIIAVVIGSKAMKAHALEPGRYTEGSFKNAQAGKVCGIIGLALSALMFLYLVFMIVIYGFGAFAMFDVMQEARGY